MAEKMPTINDLIKKRNAESLRFIVKGIFSKNVEIDIFEIVSGGNTSSVQDDTENILNEHKLKINTAYEINRSGVLQQIY